MICPESTVGMSTTRLIEVNEMVRLLRLAAMRRSALQHLRRPTCPRLDIVLLTTPVGSVLDGQRSGVPLEQSSLGLRVW
jgi:hypothetical protein